MTKKITHKIFKYLERVGIALSVLLNVLLGGQSNQTFSARNYYWKLNGRYNIVWLIDAIFFFDKDHCLMSWIYWKTAKDIRTKTLYRNINDERLNNYYYMQE